MRAHTPSDTLSSLSLSQLIEIIKETPFYSHEYPKLISAGLNRFQQDNLTTTISKEERLVTTLAFCFALSLYDWPREQAAISAPGLLAELMNVAYLDQASIEDLIKKYPVEYKQAVAKIVDRCQQLGLPTSFICEADSEFIKFRLFHDDPIIQTLSIRPEHDGNNTKSADDWITALKKNTQLTSLDLYGNVIDCYADPVYSDNAHTQFCVDYLATNTTLKSLSWYVSNANPETTNKFYAALSINTGLTELKLNNMNHDNCENIVNALKTNTTLKKITFNNIAFVLMGVYGKRRYQPVQHFADGLSLNNSLEELYFESICNLDDAHGLGILCKAIGSHPKLKKLHLRVWDGYEHIDNMLKNNKSLEDLTLVFYYNFDPNSFSLTKFFESLKHNSSLLTVKLSAHSLTFDDNTYTHLLQFIQSHPTIQSIKLYKSDSSDTLEVNRDSKPLPEVTPSETQQPKNTVAEFIEEAMKQKSKTHFLEHLAKHLNKGSFSRAEILELFDNIKDPKGQFDFIHKQTHATWDTIRLLFKSNKNNEPTYFWHTATYQKCVKLLKNAYLAIPDDTSIDKTEEDSFIDYVRGNAPIHAKHTSSRIALNNRRTP